MRYSANLNIIIKAIEKATIHTNRDFLELENLQANPMSAVKFANACYSRIKEILVNDLAKFRPDFNFVFGDSKQIIQNNDAEYNFVILPIDGLNSLARAIPDFTVAVALEHKNKDGVKESISVAINKVMSRELFYCEKGFGAFLNNRKIRVSKRNAAESPLVSVDDDFYFREEFFRNLKLQNFSWRNYGCSSLEIAYLAAGKLDLTFFKNHAQDYLKPFLLLAREAGGKTFENDRFSMASNGLIV